MTSAGAWAPLRDSSRIPPSFRPRASTSLGHLSLASSPVLRRRASAAATAVVSENRGQSPSGTRGHTRMDTSRLVPGASVQGRPRRPRPADWWSATTTVRSGLPSAASRQATACVDSTLGNRTTGGESLAGAVIEPPQARGELGAQGLLLDEARPLALDDLRGRALDEFRSSQLRPEERDALVHFADLLLEPLALGRHVHDPRQLDIDLRPTGEG